MFELFILLTENRSLNDFTMIANYIYRIVRPKRNKSKLNIKFTRTFFWFYQRLYVALAMRHFHHTATAMVEPFSTSEMNAPQDNKTIRVRVSNFAAKNEKQIFLIWI